MDLIRSGIAVVCLAFSVVYSQTTSAVGIEAVHVTIDGKTLIEPDSNTISLNGCANNTDNTLPEEAGLVDSASGRAVVQTLNTASHMVIRADVPPDPCGTEFESLKGARFFSICENPAVTSAPADDLCYVPVNDFGAGGGDERKLDVDGFSLTGDARPLVVIVHGGGWKMGSRTNSNLNFTETDLIQRGFAVARITHRFVEDNNANDILAQHVVDDVRQAVAYLIGNSVDFNIDPNQVFLLGTSAGAHLASLVSTQMSSDILGVVAYKGIYDLRGPWNPGTLTWSCPIGNCTHTLVNDPLDGFDVVELFTTTASGDDLRDLAARFLGNGAAQYFNNNGDLNVSTDAARSAAQELAMAVSPVVHYASDTPPHIFVHGDMDDLVDIVQSRQAQKILEAAKGAGSIPEVEPVPNADHGLFPAEGTLHWAKVLTFLNDLRLDPEPVVVEASWNPATITLGESSTLEWVADYANECVDPWGNTVEIVGNSGERYETVSGSHTVICTGNQGQASATASLVVNPPAPTLTASWNPSTIVAG